jgi:predicted phage-related endonuclease
VSINELDMKVKELRELRRMAEELQAEIDAAQDAIKAHMDSQGVDTLAGTDWKVTWKPVTSSRMDTTALKKALPEVAEQFMKSVTSRRFCVA